jgi:hypothetical protein
MVAETGAASWTTCPLTENGVIRIVRRLRIGQDCRELPDFKARADPPVCLSAIERHGEELAKGAIVTAEPGRLRVRPAQTDAALDE